MRILVKSVMVCSLIFCFPFIAYSDNSNSFGGLFKVGCVKSWMEKKEHFNNKAQMQDFGEKFCDCASNKSLSDDDKVQKASQVCFSQTFVNAVNFSLISKNKTKPLSENQMKTACQTKWFLLNSNADGKQVLIMNNYCQCVSSKLAPLNINSEKLVLVQNKVNDIADSCADKVEPDSVVIDNVKTIDSIGANDTTGDTD